MAFLRLLDHRNNQNMLLTGALLLPQTPYALKNRMYFNI